MALAATALTTPAEAAVTEPPPLPFEITIFPQRDFVNVVWNGSGKQLTFDLTRAGVAIGHAASDQAPPLPDIVTDAEEKLLEVNHPGGLCWTGSTPDILPGDTLSIRESGDPVGSGIAATTLDITAEPAVVDPPTGNVLVHGVARNRDGSAMDLALVEQRIISAGNLFDVNNKRDIRATSDPASLGDLEPDPPPAVVGAWTATYTGLSDADKARVLAGETRGMAWQATSPAGDRLGVTIYEAEVTGGPGMPECPAGAPYSVTVASPVAVNAANLAGGLTLSGPSSDATSVTVTLSDGTSTVSATDPSPTAGAFSVDLTGAQLAGLADGNLSATSSFVTPAGPNPIPGAGMNVLKDTLVPLPPTTDTPPGQYPAAQSVRLSRAGGESATSVVHFTTDGSAPNASSPTAQPIPVASSRTIRAVVVDAAGNLSNTVCPAGCFSYSIVPLAPAPPAPVPPAPAPPAPLPLAPLPLAPAPPAPSVAPLAPRIGAASPGAPGGASTAKVRWSAPAANGAVRDGYEVRALKIRPGRSPKVLPAVVAGPDAVQLKMALSRGTYRFQVRATSAAGNSAWSAPSAKVTAR